MRTNTNHIQATKTSLSIVDALIDLDGATATDVSSYLELPVSTTHNHLQTLVEGGYVVKDGERYRPSLRFLHIGEYTRGSYDVYEIARPVIDDLAEETGEVANLLVPEGGKGIYLHKAKGEKAVHHDTRPGKCVELHCTALGKSILMSLPSTEVDGIIETHGLPTYTDQTITDRDALFEELDRTRERGYAQNKGERNERLWCIAAPLLYGDKAVGAISVSGPKTRMKGSRFEEEIPELVLEAANVIEINLEYR
ncbi:IclR family transcriptional regulator [Halobellus sp. Atlit-31R]|nr:IclR family transcriptional regulator [Halobellus sp. Atlit-31R]